MNLQVVTYYTYHWTTDSSYGFDNEYHTSIDIDGDIKQQIKDHMHRMAEIEPQYQNLAGHLLKSTKPWYELDGKIVEIDLVCSV